MGQGVLWDWSPPAPQSILGDRDGLTFDASKDRKRLNRQAQATFNLMADGKWRTLAQIADAIQAPESSVSARLRDFRKPKFGGYIVNRKRVDGGLYAYQLDVKP
jgi:hypothetical protein